MQLGRKHARVQYAEPAEAQMAITVLKSRSKNSLREPAKVKPYETPLQKVRPPRCDGSVEPHSTCTERGNVIEVEPGG